MPDPRIIADLFPAGNIPYAFDGSIEVSVGDLMFHDTDDVKPASSMTDQGSEVLNQKYFRDRFVGISVEGRLSTNATAVIHYPVARDVIGEYDCVSSTFEVGDLLAIAEQSSGTALEDTKLKKTTDSSLAIAVVTERSAIATTRVTCRITSSHATVGGVNSSSPAQPLLQTGTSNTETLAADKNLVSTDAKIQVLNTGGTARNVDLPSEVLGLSWLVRHAGGAGDITVRDSSDATVCTVSSGESALVVSDGTSYFAICATHT